MAHPKFRITALDIACSILVLTLCYSSTSAQDGILVYPIQEESRSGEIVGPVFADAGFTQDLQKDRDGFLEFTDPADPVTAMFALSGGRILTVGERLDRDRICPGLEECTVDINLQLQPQKYFQIIKVRVTIEDINDNAPTFNDDVIYRTVSEAATSDSRIALPVAEDPDSPAFGIDHYEINDTSVFELDTATFPSRYLILKDSLNREEKDSYQIQLTAVDKGDNTGYTVLDIQVADVNDNPPVFENDTYYIIIHEDFRVQFVVLTVHATDKDLGQNAAISYSFDADSEEEYGEWFDIDSRTGSIRVTKDLDYETMESVTLVVTATNGEDSSMLSFANVHIKIGDVNDNPPIIRVRGLTSDNVVYKEETSARDDFVAHVTVSDADSGDNGKFECSLTGRDFSLVKIYDTDYVMQTNGPMDREARQWYDVVISCTDQGNPRKTGIQDIRIAITDVNDNPPVFIPTSYYSTILENQPVGTPVTIVTARDPDAGDNGTVAYHFAADFRGILHIDSRTGNISTLKEFDREETSTLEVVVVAVDSGRPTRLSASTTVTIDVIDEDDNPPSFTQSEYSFWVMEGQSAQSFVGEVTATDPDTSLYNQFGYFINHDGGDSESFIIERGSGKIYTSTILDREGKDTFSFEVRAESDGSTSKFSTATVIVHLTDINDKPPVISFPNPTNNSVYISTHTPQGTAISSIVAFDLDEGPNGELSYFIVSGNGGGYFAITQDGLILVEKPLTEFDQKAFGLVLMVSDNGSPPRSTESYLNVVVNKSLSDGGSGLMSQQNLTIVISIATVSAFLMVILTVAIVALLCCPKLKYSKRKYNYVARILDHKNSSNGQSGSTCYDNPSCDVEKGVDTRNTQGQPRNHSNGSHDAYEQQPDTRGPLHHGYKQDMTRQGRDSECSSASSADADSGRGSHEDVVLDHSALRINMDRALEPPVAASHMNRDLPLLNSLHGESRLSLTPSRNTISSEASSFRNNNGHHKQHAPPPHPPRGSAIYSQSQQHRPTENIQSSQSTRSPCDVHGYAWQNPHVSSGVHV